MLDATSDNPCLQRRWPSATCFVNNTPRWVLRSMLDATLVICCNSCLRVGNCFDVMRVSESVFSCHETHVAQNRIVTKTRVAKRTSVTKPLWPRKKCHGTLVDKKTIVTTPRWPWKQLSRNPSHKNNQNMLRCGTYLKIRGFLGQGRWPSRTLSRQAWDHQAKRWAGWVGSRPCRIRNAEAVPWIGSSS